MWTRVIVNRCICRMIATGLSLVASQLYRMAITQPWVTCRRYTYKENTLSIFPNYLVSLAISWIHTIAWDPQRRVVYYLLTWFLDSSNPNRSYSLIPCGCCERCGGVLMVGSLPSNSSVSTTQPPNATTVKVLSMGMASSNHARVRCGPIDCMYI